MVWLRQVLNGLQVKRSISTEIQNNQGATAPAHGRRRKIFRKRNMLVLGITILWSNSVTIISEWWEIWEAECSLTHLASHCTSYKFKKHWNIFLILKLNRVLRTHLVHCITRACKVLTRGEVLRSSVNGLLRNSVANQLPICIKRVCSTTLWLTVVTQQKQSVWMSNQMSHRIWYA